MSKTKISWVVAVSFIVMNPAYAGLFSKSTPKSPAEEYCSYHLKFKSYWMGNANCQPIIDAVTRAAQRGRDACLAVADPNYSVNTQAPADSAVDGNASSCLAHHTSPCEQLTKMVDEAAKPLRVSAQEMVEEAIQSDDNLYKQIRDQKFPGVDYFMQEDCKKITANATAQVWYLERELKKSREHFVAGAEAKQPPTPPQPGVKCNHCGVSTMPSSVSANAPSSVSASAPSSVSANAPSSVSAQPASPCANGKCGNLNSTQDSAPASVSAQGPRPCGKCGLNNGSAPSSVSANVDPRSSCANGNCRPNGSAPVDAPADAPSGPQVLRPVPDTDPVTAFPVPAPSVVSQPLPEPAPVKTAAPKPAPLIDAPAAAPQPVLGNSRDTSAPAVSHPAPVDAPADAPKPVVHHRRKHRKPAQPAKHLPTDAPAGDNEGVMVPVDMAVKAAAPEYKAKSSLFHSPTPAEVGQYQDEQRIAKDKTAKAQGAKEDETRRQMEHSYVSPKAAEEQKAGMSAFQKILKAHQPSPAPINIENLQQ